MSNLDWMDDAICTTVGTEVFFPEVNKTQSQQARKVCQACPVTRECLDYALAIEMPHGTTLEGIWGGVTQAGRRRIKREKRASDERRRVQRDRQTNGAAA